MNCQTKVFGDICFGVSRISRICYPSNISPCRHGFAHLLRNAGDFGYYPPMEARRSIYHLHRTGRTQNYYYIQNLDLVNQNGRRAARRARARPCHAMCAGEHLPSCQRPSRPHPSPRSCVARVARPPGAPEADTPLAHMAGRARSARAHSGSSPRVHASTRPQHSPAPAPSTPPHRPLLSPPTHTHAPSPHITTCTSCAQPRRIQSSLTSDPR